MFYGWHIVAACVWLFLVMQGAQEFLFDLHHQWEEEAASEHAYAHCMRGNVLAENFRHAARWLEEHEDHWAALPIRLRQCDPPASGFSMSVHRQQEAPYDFPNYHQSFP